MLTAADIAHYHEHGYVVPDWRLPGEQLAAMRAAADNMLAANPQYADLHPALLEEGEPWPFFARNENIVGMVRQLIGDDASGLNELRRARTQTKNLPR